MNTDKLTTLKNAYNIVFKTNRIKNKKSGLKVLGKLIIRLQKELDVSDYIFPNLEKKYYKDLTPSAKNLLHKYYNSVEYMTIDNSICMWAKKSGNKNFYDTGIYRVI